MQNNYLLKNNDDIIRVLDVQHGQSLIIDCIKLSMPKWILNNQIDTFVPFSENDLSEITGIYTQDMEDFSANSRKFIHEHFSLIASILPYISEPQKRNEAINTISEERGVSKTTIRKYLCLYLAYQDMSVFAPKKKNRKLELSTDEKNMRWALNKFYYTRKKNTLNTAYTMLLKEKYCDTNGKLLTHHPSFYQFRYFYRKTKKLQTYYISRNGIKNYQRNNRPLIGDGVQQFAPNVGIGMLDATVCDIYLVDNSGNLVGRPILTTCIDAYSSLCCGYALTWEGGIYSLKNLMLNIITDKVELCKKHGIIISKQEWDIDQVPGVMITDKGSEYKSEVFEQLTELGITITNLPPYRPELKGSVEKFFDLVQGYYKEYLKGKGVVNPDFQERGCHDYRKDACLTLEDFEKIILRCILYYNSQRILKNFPYTEDMIKNDIQPYANTIFEYGKKRIGANLISVSSKNIIYSMLPRITGKFSRRGLIVNKMRYHCDGYTEEYLNGDYVKVAYDSNDVTTVWAILNGEYVPFNIIENRFKGMDITETDALLQEQKRLVAKEEYNNMQSKIDLAKYIETIANNVCRKQDTKIKNVKQTRKRETYRTHIDHINGGVDYE